MKQEFFVSKPVALMHLCPDGKSEVTDELLYGTRVNKLDESYGGYVLCRTQYGYDGYIDEMCISQRRQRGERLAVVSRFCDFYKHPDHRYAPVMTLPLGSVLEGDVKESRDSGFICVCFDGKEFFVHRNNIKELSVLSDFESEKQKRKQLVKTAFSYLGTPYRWGGKSTYGIDCSGFCFMCYTLCGLGLYRDAEFDARYLKKIAFCELLAGDLIYYNGHVTMYVGGNEYIHSSSTLGGVRTGSFDKNSKKFYPRLADDIVCCARSLAFE